MKKFMRFWSRSGLCLSVLLMSCTHEVSPRNVGTGPGSSDSRNDAVFAANWAFPPSRVPAAYARDGMVVTTDPVASEIGAEILRRGGNAVDAAIAVQFVLAVVNPEAGNIGGGGFMIVHHEGESLALDFREKAPLAAHADMYQNASSRQGALAAGVPGSVAGMWEAHKRFGTRPWTELLAPAIHLAEGLVVHRRLANSLERYEDRLRTFSSTEAIFLPNGQVPKVGSRLIQADLAETLRRIATEGRDGFYKGTTAALVVAEMQRGNGIITSQDLERYEAIWRQPIRFSYRGHEVVSMPPPSSGGVTLAQLLLILERVGLGSTELHSAQYLHVWAEASKRAFVDRNTLLGDPDFHPDQPIKDLSSPSYAIQRSSQIQSHRATPSNKVSAGFPVSTSATPPESPHFPK